MRRDEADLRHDAPIPIDELKARALALAQSEDGAATLGTRVPFLAFGAAGEWFALPLAGVHEVIRGSRVVPIPYTPVAVRGVVNRRGDLVPVLDLAVLFGRPAGSGGDAIVIVGHAPMLAGLLTDGWPEIVDVSDAAFAALPHQNRFVRGVCRHGDRLIKGLVVEQLVEPDLYRSPQAMRAGDRAPR